MNEKLLITFVLLLLAQKIWTVDLDYLSGDSKDETDRKNNNMETTPDSAAGDAQYHGQSRPSKESRKLLNSLKKFSIEQVEEKQVHKATNAVRPTLNVSTRAIDAVRPTLTVSTRKHPLEVFLDYDYQYQYTKTENNNKNDQPKGNNNITKVKSYTSSDSPPHSALRNNPKFRLAINSNRTSISNMTNIKNNTDSHDVYMLEPVAEQVDLTFDPDADTEKLSTWYSVENLPCWELPYVFGELDKSKRNAGVFQIFAYTLKNVEVDDEKRDYDEEGGVVTPEKNMVWQLEHEYNKWCGFSPCFADHTLCLFPTNSNSKICSQDYKVRGLSMWEYGALTNILNSMRNHVAEGSRNQYPFLPSAANMKQVHYDKDLELMAERWLQQCLPGPSPCLSFDNQYITQLECTKQLKKCCRNGENILSHCKPEEECYVHPVIGCLYKWYWAAGKTVDQLAVECGHIERSSYTLAQLLWAETVKIGCAYGSVTNGDVRVVCNFFPGAPFKLSARYYCGVTLLKDNYAEFKQHASYFHLDPVEPIELNTTTSEPYTGQTTERYIKSIRAKWGVNSLRSTYKEKWIRGLIENFSNGTIGIMARLVTRYKFREQSNARCDENEPMYVIGEPAALCAETSRKFKSLCYDFRDPTPGYRWVAIGSAVSLFLLILYDLFSGVMRQLHTD